MRRRNEKGFLFLIISIIFLLIPFTPNLTGALIDSSINVVDDFSYFYIVGLVFFIFSALIFASKQTLDVIMIPTGGYEADKKRTRRAYEEGKENPEQIYLISGRIDKPVKGSQVHEIYKQLRNYGIKPVNMRIEGKSANTLENVLFSLEKLKKMGAHDVGIASYSLHLDRFEDLIEEAKKQRLIGKDFRIHRLETSQSFKDMLYGFLHRAVYRYELSHGGFDAVGKSKFRDIKQKLTRFLNYFSPKKEK